MAVLSLPSPVCQALEAALGASVVAAQPVSGGDINEARRVDLADGRRVFLKFRSDADPAMFVAEASGLAWLSEPGALRVPRTLAVGGPAPSRGRVPGSNRPTGRARDATPAADLPSQETPILSSPVPFLALEWLEPGRSGPDFDARLGEGLARLHRAGAPGFGWSEPNFLATLPQDNRPERDWPTFYARRRLAPLLRCAEEARLVPPDWSSAFGRLSARLPDLAGPPEPPARLHGDLWSGNVHRDSRGAPCLIDPAVYGGHREMDLAMLALFGSPSPAFFAAYEGVWPLSAGWRERMPLWQLYPLLAHVCLFGAGYVGSVDGRLRSLLA